MSFCENCGTQLVEGMLFCTKCGTKIEEPLGQVASPAASTPVARPADQDPVAEVAGNDAAVQETLPSDEGVQPVSCQEGFNQAVEQQDAFPMPVASQQPAPVQPLSQGQVPQQPAPTQPLPQPQPQTPQQPMPTQAMPQDFSQQPMPTQPLPQGQVPRQVEGMLPATAPAQRPRRKPTTPAGLPKAPLKKMLILAAVVFVVSLGGFTAFALFGRSQGGTAPASPAAQTQPAATTASAAAPVTSSTSPSTPATQAKPAETPKDQAKAGTPVRNGLADYSWKELSAIAKEIAATQSYSEALRVAEGYHLVGANGAMLDATKDVDLGSGIVARVRVADVWHDTAASGGRAGITLLANNVPLAHAMQTTDVNAGGWESSLMRSWLNGTVLGTLPAELRDVVVPVVKMTNNTGHSSDPACVTATTDALWIPSVAEVAGNSINWDWSSDSSNSPRYNAIMNAEGTQYACFSRTGIVNDAANAALVLRAGGVANEWWLRSSSSSVSDHYRKVGADGDPSLFDDSSKELGVCLGFCL